MARMQGRQAGMPGGRLAYITCSVLPSENRDQVDAFITRHLEFSIVPWPGLWEAAGLSAAPPQSADGSTESLLMTPQSFGTDGFYLIASANRGLVDIPAHSGFQTFDGRVTNGDWHFGVNLFREDRGNGTPVQVNNSHMELIDFGVKKEKWQWNFLTLIPSGRYDINSQFGDTANPRVQAMIEAADWLSFFSSVDRPFRAPTLEESRLNADINPEKAWTYEAGFETRESSRTLSTTPSSCRHRHRIGNRSAV